MPEYTLLPPEKKELSMPEATLPPPEGWDSKEWDNIVSHIKKYEKFQSHPFKDTDMWRVGYGTPYYKGGSAVTEEWAANEMNKRLINSVARLTERNPNFPKMPFTARKAMLDFAYNLGDYANFPKMWDHFQKGNLAGVRDEMMLASNALKGNIIRNEDRRKLLYAGSQSPSWQNITAVQAAPTPEQVASTNNKGVVQ